MEEHENLEQIHKYVSHSKTYLKNAELLSKKKEFHKAGEMLWGSIALLLKAIGLIYDRPTGNHKQLIKLAQHIYIITNDVDLRNGIKQYGEALHSNFYQHFIDEEGFYKHRTPVIESYNKLFQILNDALGEKLKVKSEYKD